MSLAPVPKLGPDLLQSAELRVAAQIHVEVLVPHREQMKNCANSLRTIEFLRKRLVVIAHRDHAFTGTATGSPIEITLMSGEGWQAHLCTEEINDAH